MRLVVFDLDGTITRHDTFVPYVFGFLGRRPLRLVRFAAASPLVLVVLLGFLLRLADHGDVKAAVLRAALRGCSRGELERWTATFVQRLIVDGMHAEALAAIAEHRRRGDRLVLMSASPDLYVPAIAAQLGFDEVVCTGVRWAGDRLDGRLATANRRGDEKTRCFRELKRRHPSLSTVAYANGPSDMDHLRLADQAVLVNGLAWAGIEAERAGIRCVEWR